MIELYFLLIGVPRRMFKLAKPRGKSGCLWSLAASGAWLLVEVSLILLLFLMIDGMGPDTSGSRDLGFVVVLLYIGPLVAGIYAYELVRKRLESFPVSVANGPTNENDDAF